MAIYRFRVTFEDQDEVHRDIDVKGTQSFRDLADCILRSVGFDDKHNASFFISDDLWREGIEYVLRVEDKETGVGGKKKPAPLKLMEKAKVVNHIDDPHQKFIFVYDYKEQWTFHIELARILVEEPAAVYPRIVKSTGTPPKQYKQMLPPPEEEEEDLLSKLKKKVEDDEEPTKEQIVVAEEGMDEEDLERTSEMSEEGDDVAVEGEEAGSEGEAEGEGQEFGAEEEEH